jgi:hypothetical protein
MAESPNTLEEIADAILDIISDCDEANKADTDEEYESIAMSAIPYWQSAVHHIIGLHPYFFPLNNLLSLLNLDKAEFQQNYRDLLLDLSRTCRAYQPFSVLLQGEFGNTLDSFLEEMLSDVDTDDGMED